MKISFGDIILTGAAVLVGAKLGFDFAVFTGLYEHLPSKKEEIKELIKDDEELLNDFIEAKEQFKEFKKDSTLNDEDFLDF